VAILYALAFLLIPVTASLFFSDFAEPRAVLYLRFCGAAILAWGLIKWFARDFQDLVRRSQHSDWQHCQPRREHHHYRLCRLGRMAQRQRLGKRSRVGATSYRHAVEERPEGEIDVKPSATNFILAN
jgi:hypothetical protein